MNILIVKIIYVLRVTANWKEDIHCAHAMWASVAIIARSMFVKASVNVVHVSHLQVVQCVHVSLDIQENAVRNQSQAVIYVHLIHVAIRVFVLCSEENSIVSVQEAM